MIYSSYLTNIFELLDFRVRFRLYVIAKMQLRNRKTYYVIVLNEFLLISNLHF